MMDKKFYKQISVIAIPIILQGMITAGLGMMDTFMVGKLGEVQLSATSLATQFISIFMIMCFGIGFGAAVLTAQFYGANNNGALKKIITIMLRVGLALSILFTIATLLMPETIMALYTPDTTIIAQGVLYFDYGKYFFVFMAISLTLTAVLRTVGQVRLPLITSLITFIVNVVLNYTFIFGHFGMPAMGVQGAALATLCSRILESLIIAGYFLFFEKRIGYRIKDLFDSCKAYIPMYVTICMPVLISDTMLALGNNMVTVIMGHIGVSFLAANAIISQIFRMTIVFTQGVSSSSSVMVGQTVGSGDNQLAYRQGIAFTWLSLIVGIIGAALLLLITPLVINMFDMTPETRLVADQLKYAMAVMFVFQSIGSTLTKGVLRGGGDTKFLMLADILFLWVASVPLGYFAGLVWALPAFWVFIALKIDNILKSLWCLMRLRSKKWLKKVDDVNKPKELEEVTI